MSRRALPGELEALRTLALYAKGESVEGAEIVDHPSVMMIRATELYREGNYAEAYELFKNILRKNPEMVEAKVNMGFALVRMGRDDEAFKTFKSLPEEYVNEYVLNEMGCILARKGDWRRAMEYFNRSIERNPELSLPRMNLVALLIGQGKIEDAKVQLSAVLGEGGGSELKLLAYIEYFEGKYEDALRHIVEYLDNDGEDHEAWLLRAECEALLGKMQDAENSAEKSYSIKKTLLAKAALAMFKMENGKVEEAMKLAEGVLAKQPDNIRAHAVLARGNYETGKYREAIEHADVVLKIREDAKIRMIHGESARRLGMHDVAIEDANVILSTNPDYRNAKILKALALAGKGSVDDAIKLLDSARDPEDFLIYTAYAEIYCGIGNRGRCADSLERALVYRRDMNILRKLCILLYEMGEKEKLEVYLKELADVKSKDAYVWFIYGELYFDRDRDAAEKYYRMAIEIDDKLVDALAKLIAIYAVKGEGQKVEDYLSKFKDAGADAGAWRQVFQSLMDAGMHRLILKHVSDSVKLTSDESLRIYKVRALLELGDYEEALHVAEDLYKNMPENLEVALYLGISYYYVKKYSEAMQVLEKARKSYEVEANYYIAKIYFETGRAAEALELVDRYGEEERFVLLKMEILFFLKSFDSLLSYVDEKIGILSGRFLTEALIYKMKAYFEMGDLDRGFEVAGEVLERVPDDAGVMALLARKHLEIGSYEEAVKFARNAYEMSESEEHAYLYALSLYEAGKYEDALEVVEKHEGTGGEYLLLKAKIYLALENYEKCLEFATDALETDGDNIEAMVILGKAYYLLEDYRNSAYYFEKVFLKDLSNYNALYYLPISYNKLGDYEKAEKMFERALEKYSDMRKKKEFMESYASTEIELQKYDIAVDILESIEKKDDSTLLLLGKARYLMGRYREAVKHLSAISSQGGEKAYYLSLSYIAMNENQKAVEVLNSISDEEGDMLYYHGLALYNLSKYEEALAKFEAYRKQGGSKDLLDFYQGACLFNLGRYEESLVFLQRAEHTSDESFRYEAIAHFRLENHEEAVKFFKICARKDLMDGEMWAMYGEALEKIGESGLEMFNRAWKMDYRTSKVAHLLLQGYYEKGDYEKASEYVPFVSKDNPEAAILAAKVLMELERYGEALEFLESMEGEEGRILRGKILMKMGRTMEAVSTLEAIGDSPEAAYLLVKLLLAQNEYSRALKYLDAGEKHGDLTYERMVIYFNLEEWEQALEVAMDLIGRGEAVQEATYIAGLSLYNMERYEDAIPYLSKVTEMGEDVSYHLGMCYFHMGDYENAAKYLRDAEEGRYEYALSLYNLGKYGDALPVFESIDDDEARMHAGLCAFKMGDYELAVKYLERSERVEELAESYFMLGRYEDVIKLNPNNPRLLGMAYYRMGDFENSLKVLESVKDKNAEDYYHLAIASVHIGNYERAREYLRSAKAMGYEGDVSEVEGIISYREGNYEKAVELLKNAEGEESRVMYGISLYHLGRYREAASALEGVRDEEGMRHYALSQVEMNDPDGIRRALEIFLKIGDDKNAARCYLKMGNYRKVLDIVRGDDEESLRLRFEASMNLRLYDDALAIYNRMSFDDRSRYAKDMCMALVDEGRYDEAGRIMKNHFVEDFDWLMMRAKVNIAHEDYQGAVRDLKKAKKIKSDAPDVSRLLAPLLLNMGKNKEALREAKSAVKKFPDDAVCWYNLGVAYNKNNKDKDAIKALERSLEIDPNILEAWHLLGLIHLHSGNYEKAYESLSKVKDRIEDRDVLFSLATTAYELEKYDEAMEYIDSALKMRKDATALYYRALILIELDREDEAMSALKEAIKMNPNFLEARKLLGSLMGGE